MSAIIYRLCGILICRWHCLLITIDRSIPSRSSSVVRPNDASWLAFLLWTSYHAAVYWLGNALTEPTLYLADRKICSGYWLWLWSTEKARRRQHWWACRIVLWFWSKHCHFSCQLTSAERWQDIKCGHFLCWSILSIVCLLSRLFFFGLSLRSVTQCSLGRFKCASFCHVFLH